MEVKFKKLSQNAKLPSYSTEGSAGMDVYSIQHGVIPATERKIFSTGIAIELPTGTFAKLESRSGFALRNGLSCLSGVIDQDYRGELRVILQNHGKDPIMITKGMRIAQLVVIPLITLKVTEVVELSLTQRGDKGFGSTGTN